MRASAQDDVGVESVTFLVDGQERFVDVAAPFAFDVSLPVQAGAVEFGAIANDLRNPRMSVNQSRIEVIPFLEQYFITSSGLDKLSPLRLSISLT